MADIEITLKLSEELAELAKDEGLLDQPRIEELLWRELEAAKNKNGVSDDENLTPGEELLRMLRKLRAVQPELTQEEIDEEVEAGREEAHQLRPAQQRQDSQTRLNSLKALSGEER